MTVWRHVIGLGMAAIVVIGCGGRRTQPTMGQFGPIEDDSISVVVVNRNFLDANIYISYVGSGRRRLGTARGSNQARFRTRWLPNELQFQIDLIGAGQYCTEMMIVNPGDVVELELPVNLERSAFRTRCR